MGDCFSGVVDPEVLIGYAYQGRPDAFLGKLQYDLLLDLDAPLLDYCLFISLNRELERLNKNFDNYLSNEDLRGLESVISQIKNNLLIYNSFIMRVEKIIDFFTEDEINKKNLIEGVKIRGFGIAEKLISYESLKKTFKSKGKGFKTFDL